MDATAVHSATEMVAAASESGTKLQDLAWAVLFIPLVCAFGTLLFTRKDRLLTAGFNIGGVLLSFILSAILFAVFGGQRVDCTPFHWLPLEGLDATIGLHLDGPGHQEDARSNRRSGPLRATRLSHHIVTPADKPDACAR